MLADMNQLRGRKRSLGAANSWRATNIFVRSLVTVFPFKELHSLTKRALSKYLIIFGQRGASFAWVLTIFFFEFGCSLSVIWSLFSKEKERLSTEVGTGEKLWNCCNKGQRGVSRHDWNLGDPSEAVRRD